MLNKVVLQGRLTRDPEISLVGDGIPLCKFSIAVSGRKGGKSEVTFIDCQAWRWLAEHIKQWFVKGQETIVDGELRIDVWEKDGKKGKSVYILANDVYFCGKKPEQNIMPATTPAFTEVSLDDGDVPF